MIQRLTILFATTVLVLAEARLEAALIQLTAADGSDALDLVDTADLQIRMTTAAFDTINLSFINAFLDTTGSGIDADSVDVGSVTGGAFGWTYDRSSFPNLPAEIDQAGSGDEYGLVSGNPDGLYFYPLGASTYVHDTLGLVNTNAPGVVGDVFVTFELGARQPQAFGPPPGFTPFTLAPPPFFLPGIPNFMYLGNDTSGNGAFTIHVPEPAMLLLVATCTAGILGRRKEMRSTRGA